jgi:hypothetical protein
MSTHQPDPVETPDAIEVRPSLALEAQTHAEVDVQIATARRYPRSVRTFIDEALAMATLDEDVAGSCFYALPRDGKTIDGPSVRLAEIVASAWGHMRVQARIADEDERFVTARGEAWDIQRNVAIAFETRRRITDKKGKKYSDDMVMVSGNAASSVALRNAIFKVIPSAFWRPIYLKCREVAVGKADTLVSKRTAMLAYFQKMGVDEPRVLATLDLRGVEDIGLEQLATLRGLATAVKEGETTVDEAFPAPAASVLTMPQRVSAQQPVPPAPDPPQKPPPPPPPPGPFVDRIQEARPIGTGWGAYTESGVQVWTRDRVLGERLLAAQGQLRHLTADPPDAQGRRKLTALEG